MSAKDELEAFRKAHPGLVHLVYGDVTSGMVLFAASDADRGQEAHDRMIEEAVRVLDGAAGSLVSGEGDIHIAITDAVGLRVFARSAASPDEALALGLRRGTDATGIGTAATAILTQLAGGEG